MQINWFTVIAQLVNFILLVWLMKRFLYVPILNAIDQREQKIKAQLADASTQKADAQTEKDAFSQKNTAFDAQKKALLDTAVADTEAERQKLLEAARQEAEALRAKQQKALQETQDTMQADIAQQTREAVFAITKKTLTDLASVGLEEQTLAVFLARMQQLTATEKQSFIDAFQSDKKQIKVQSAFALTETQQTALTTAVTNLLGSKPDIVFTTSPTLISGIVLSANGFKLAWSVTDYLTALEKSSSPPHKKPKQAAVALPHVSN